MVSVEGWTFAVDMAVDMAVEVLHLWVLEPEPGCNTQAALVSHRLSAEVVKWSLHYLWR